MISQHTHGGGNVPEELEIFDKLAAVEDIPDFYVPFTGNNELDQKLHDHKVWLNSIRHEQPSLKKHFRVGIYIRYFNQTKYDNYLDYLWITSTAIASRTATTSSSGLSYSRTNLSA